MQLSTAQACALIGVSRNTLAKLIRTGQIEAFKGEGRNAHVKVPEESVNAYLERRRIKVAGGAE